METLSEKFKLPVTRPEHIAAVCDLAPVQPGDRTKLYVNLAARQGGDRIDRLEKRLRYAGDGVFRRELVTGHAGSGKSTELLRLAGELRRPKGGKSFHVVYVDANERLGMWNLRLPQIVLAMIGALSEEPRLDLKNNQAASSFSARLKAIAGAIGGELAKRVDGIAGIEVLGSAIRASQELSNQFRDKAAAQMQELLRSASDFVAEVARQLASDVVFIIDNLEKVPEQVIEGGRSLHEVLFVQELPLLDLPGHQIFTYPISLNYWAYELTQRYPASSKTTLPMVSVRESPDDLDRPRGDDDVGIDLLVECLARRIDIDQLFDERETVRHLVKLSGGCVRDVMRFAGALPVVNDHPPYDVQAVNRAVADFTSDYERLLGGKDYVAMLPAIATTGQFTEAFGIDSKREILLGLVALEYDTATWFDVHPLVKRTRAYRAAERAGRG